MPKVSGYIILDGREAAETLSCCHCGRAWITRPGSGTRRGFCMCCGKVTCGSKACDVCVPLEARLELWEGRKNKYAGLITL